jgi:hypothetical protein
MRFIVQLHLHKYRYVPYHHRSPCLASSTATVLKTDVTNPPYQRRSTTGRTSMHGVAHPREYGTPPRLSCGRARCAAALSASAALRRTSAGNPSAARWRCAALVCARATTRKSVSSLVLVAAAAKTCPIAHSGHRWALAHACTLSECMGCHAGDSIGT